MNFSPRTLWLSFLIAGMIGTASGTIVALARDNGQWAQVSPEQRRWIEQLQNKVGIRCCVDADGYDAEWDTLGDKYRVKIEGIWYTVPDEALVTEPNRIGTAKVWWIKNTQGLTIRCFMPGAQG